MAITKTKKKKAKRVVNEGVAHIFASFNNTIITTSILIDPVVSNHSTKLYNAPPKIAIHPSAGKRMRALYFSFEVAWIFVYVQTKNRPQPRG